MHIDDIVQEYIAFAEKQRGAEVYYRESWGCYYFSLLGKTFGLLTPEIITLKGHPQDNIRLRETYSDVVAGYHMNKQHWNSIKPDTEQLSMDEIKEMIRVSYELVYDKLPKKDKEIIDEMPLRD